MTHERKTGVESGPPVRDPAALANRYSAALANAAIASGAGHGGPGRMTGGDPQERGTRVRHAPAAGPATAVPPAPVRILRRARRAGR